MRSFLHRKEFKFMLSGNMGFSQEQADKISEEHNRCMQGVIKYFGEQLWLSLCTIAGLIGRHVQNDT